MSAVDGRPRVLAIRTGRSKVDRVRVTVQGTGVRITEQEMERSSTEQGTTE